MLLVVDYIFRSALVQVQVLEEFLQEGRDLREEARQGRTLAAVLDHAEAQDRALG